MQMQGGLVGVVAHAEIQQLGLVVRYGVILYLGTVALSHLPVQSLLLRSTFDPQIRVAPARQL